jgi:hypothetical protein
MSAVRSISTIQQSILSAIQSNPTLGTALTSPSSTAIYNLFAYIIATSQATEEQLMNVYQAQVEGVAASAPPGTAQWIQNQAFNFQYSATDPQTIQLNGVTLAPEWPTINSSYRIISRCSVTTTFSNQVAIKVATGTVPVPLSTPQLSAFQSFFNYVKPCGIIYNCISIPADLIYCAANVTYLGSYSGTISANLKTAYLNYLANVPFNGLFRLSDLELALKSVTGVVDVEFKNVNIRAYTDPFPALSPVNGCNIVGNYTQVAISYNPYSGYFVDETTLGHDFVNSLTLLPI